MIAGSILMSRALAPVEQAMGSWKTVLAARAAFARLQDLLDSMPQNPNAMPIPNPKGDVSVENIGYRYPEGEKPALARIDFELADGETLGIMGPTASGKSTLSRLIAGNLKPTTGHVRLSGVADRRVRHDDIADHAARHVLEHGRVQQINIRRDIVLEGEVVFVELVVTNTIQGKRTAICKGNNRIPANLAQAVRDHVRKVDKTGVLQIDDIFAASARLEVVDNVAAVAETALDEIVTAAAADNVVAFTAGETVVAVAAIQRIVALVAPQVVVAEPACELVIAGTAVKLVVVRAAVEIIRTFAAIETVRAAATLQVVVTVAADQPVVTVTAVNDVVAFAAINVVRPLGAGQRVRAFQTENLICLGRSDDRVVLRSSS